MFLPDIQLESPIKLVFVLFTSEETTCDAIGKHCLSDGRFECRLPKVDSPGFELCWADAFA